MTPLFLLSLICLSVSPALMRLRYGKHWMSRPFGLLVAAAVIYHGISEIAIRATGAGRFATNRPPEDYIDQGMLIAGLGLFAMTFGYLVTSRPESSGPAFYDREALARVFDWRLLAVLTAPLMIATIAGQGYASGRVLEGQGLNQEGLTVQFFVPLTILTAFGLLLRHPRRFALIVSVQSLVMAVAGQRLEIFIAAVALGLLCARVGIRPSRQQVVRVAVIAGIAAFAISSVRASAGRTVFQSDTGATARIQALWDGLLNPQFDSVNGAGPIGEAGIRLNSTVFVGNVVQSFETNNLGPIGPRPLTGAILTAVPSVLFPSKVNSLSVYDRSPKAAQIAQLRMPATDYLPGHVTLFYGALGLPLLLLFNLAVGALLGALDRIVLRRQEPLALVGFLLLALAALFFERGIDTYLLIGRSFIVFVVAVALWRRLPSLRRQSRPDPAMLSHRK